MQLLKDVEGIGLLNSGRATGRRGVYKLLDASGVVVALVPVAAGVDDAIGDMEQCPTCACCDVVMLRAVPVGVHFTKRTTYCTSLGAAIHANVGQQGRPFLSTNASEKKEIKKNLGEGEETALVRV